MSHILKAGAGGLGLCALYLAIGCASTGAGDSGPTPVAATASAGPSTQAVSCSRCQVTYIQVQTNDPKGRFIGYTARKEMECPDCKTAAQTFFDTGKLQHTCTRCQGTMEVCEGHT